MKIIRKIIAWIKSIFSKKIDYIINENFKGNKINLRKWRTQQHWGGFHKKRTWVYTDKSCSVVKDGNLELSVKHKPKEIKLDGVTYNPKFARGNIEHLNKVGKGIHEFKCYIPESGWYAVWMWGKTTEIDMVEGTKKEGFNMANHIHWDNYENRESRQYKVLVGWHIFRLKWDDDLTFYMDGVIIRHDANVNYLDDGMWLELSINIHENDQLEEKPFLVDWYRYWKP